MDGTLEHLRLMASAISGRPLAVEPGRPGERSWTDGSTLYLDPTAAPAQQVLALAVQASLLAAGSLDRDVLTRLVRRRGAAERYLAVEGHRALAWNRDVVPPAFRRMTDHAVAGSVAHPTESVAIALGRTPLPPAPPEFGAIRPRQVIDEAARAGDATAAASPQAGAPATQLDVLQDEDEDDDGGDSLGQLLSSPVGGGGPVGKLLRRLLGHTRDRDAGGGPPGADAPTHTGRVGNRGVRTGWSTASTPEAVGELPGGTELLPEWNVHRREYRPDWCRVVQCPPPEGSSTVVPMPDLAAFRRSLSRLGLGLERSRRQPDGDEIDLDAAVEAQVTALAGLAPDEGLYVQSLRRRRDLSVLVLLDVSGSADQQGTAGRTVHEHQCRTAATLTVALHDLGDRVGLEAFNSRGREAVQVVRLKGLDDDLDGQVLERLGALVPAAYTRLGAAIRHGSAVLDERGTPRRLLVVISDGVAYDHGYEGRYGEADARRALLEARRRGIGCLCLTVGTGVETDALRRVFGTAAHASALRTAQLPEIIAPLFRAALRSAEHQQRSHQRRERSRERLAIEGGRW